MINCGRRLIILMHRKVTNLTLNSPIREVLIMVDDLDTERDLPFLRTEKVQPCVTKNRKTHKQSVHLGRREGTGVFPEKARGGRK